MIRSLFDNYKPSAAIGVVTSTSVGLITVGGISSGYAAVLATSGQTVYTAGVSVVLLRPDGNDQMWSPVSQGGWNVPAI